ncbi:MAG: class I SAM-dependent methyltransferase [Saprospiraceae bacterium]
MSNTVISSPIQYHNQVQLDYFGQKIKKTMIPVNSPYVLNHIDKILDFSQISREDKVLDVGCGMGKFTLPLAERGYQVAGLDLSPFLLQQFLRYNDNRFQIPLIAADILDAPEELNEKFDALVGFFALHHFHNLSVCFQAMARLVKPGGKLFFIEPNAYHIPYYLQIFFTPGMSWKGDKGVADMRPSKIKAAAEFAKLEQFKYKRYGALPPFAANTKMGQKIEPIIEKVGLLNPVLAFHYFEVQKPL